MNPNHFDQPVYVVGVLLFFVGVPLALFVRNYLVIKARRRREGR